MIKTPTWGIGSSWTKHHHQNGQAEYFGPTKVTQFFHFFPNVSLQVIQEVLSLFTTDLMSSF